MLNNFRKSKLLENYYSFIICESETKYKVHFEQKSTVNKNQNGVSIGKKVYLSGEKFVGESDEFFPV